MISLSLKGKVESGLQRVKDPCSVARGTPIGLVDMGLVVDISLVDLYDGVRVELTMRVTAPGCLYWSHFESAVHAELTALDEVSQVTFRWTDDYDWEPSAMTPRGRELSGMRAAPGDRRHRLPT
jgi:metal-sulfur cluster biosynthetic enzyme